ncbi:MAG TPA: hypothetical protein VN892_05505 [Solirubrobacteraceae bacterium]|nr:hypothetical protein [Solirubrobacteraceae bacterium]
MDPGRPGAQDEADGAAPLQSALTFGGGQAMSWGSQASGVDERESGAGRGRAGVVALGAAVVVAVVIGAAVAIHGGGASSASTAGAAAPTGSLAQAAYVTTQAPGFQFDMTMSAGVGGNDFTIDAEGAFDERQLEGAMTLQIAGQSTEEIVKSPYIYVQLPSGDAALTGGKPWSRVDLDTFRQALGAGGPLGQNAASPTQMLDMLTASGQVSTVGSEVVRGVATTHYHALVDFNRYAAMVSPSQRTGMEDYAQELQRITGSSSLPIDVWIDSHQRVRRFSTEVDVCTPQGRLDETVAMDLYNYGPQQTVTVPAPSEVSDVTGTLASQASGAMAQLSC